MQYPTPERGGALVLEHHIAARGEAIERGHPGVDHGAATRDRSAQRTRAQQIEAPRIHLERARRLRHGPGEAAGPATQPRILEPQHPARLVERVQCGRRHDAERAAAHLERGKLRPQRVRGIRIPRERNRQRRRRTAVDDGIGARAGDTGTPVPWIVEVGVAAPTGPRCGRCARHSRIPPRRVVQPDATLPGRKLRHQAIDRQSYFPRHDRRRSEHRRTRDAVPRRLLRAAQ